MLVGVIVFSWSCKGLVARWPFRAHLELESGLAIYTTLWGTTVHADRKHFELLVLEGAQAGLSWLTVLKRRDGYRRAFADFDPAVVATFDGGRLREILADPSVVRHRLKVESVASNAVALTAIQQQFGSFDRYVWDFVGGVRIVNRWEFQDQIPATTGLSSRLSADLRQRGFAFVGPTVCYAYLQAAGLVLDHVVGCFRFMQLLSGLQ
jgi:DNA-3-methyladenine glycosylase I